MHTIVVKFGALLIAAASGLIGSGLAAQDLSPYSDFQSLSASELTSLQVKITYLGPVTYPVPTLAFTSPAGHIDLAAFAPYRRAGWEEQYGMDDFAVISFRVSTEMLQAVLDSVAALPGVTDGGVDSSGYVSFALLKTEGGTRVFDSIVGEENGAALLRKVEEALATDSNAVRLTRECACEMALTYDDPPEDVTSNVEIRSSGFRRIRDTDTYVASTRVTNASAIAIPAPLTLLPRVKGMAVELMGESGFTCRIGIGGEAFLDLPVEVGGLAPGTHVDVVLRVDNPDNERFDISPAVFAGRGTR